jgi:putative lipoprotein
MMRPLALLCMLIAGCAAAPVTMESLAGTRWVATGFAGPQAPTLDFAPDARVSGTGGCNRYFGTAGFTPGALRFGKLGSTRMACPGPSMQDETRFFHALNAVRAARVEDEALLLLDESGGEVLRLTRAK